MYAIPNCFIYYIITVIDINLYFHKNSPNVAGSEYVNYEVMLGAQIYIVLSILTFHTNFIR